MSNKTVALVDGRLTEWLSIYLDILKLVDYLTGYRLSTACGATSSWPASLICNGLGFQIVVCLSELLRVNWLVVQQAGISPVTQLSH